jgi:hypothetical protein
MDGFIDRYVKTIPFSERMAALSDIVRLQSDQVQMLPLFYSGAAYVLGSNRLQNVLGGNAQAWNAHLWDLV